MPNTLPPCVCAFALLLATVPGATGQPASGDASAAREATTGIGMKLVYIRPGKFIMGSPPGEPGREAQEVQHEVELTKGFYLGTCEVTVGQFRQFVTETKYQTDGERDGRGAYGINEAGKIEQMQPTFTWKSPGFEQADDHPVVNVSWNDARAFCRWLSQKEKKAYRLPTEAEWEYACRAGTRTAYTHGDDPEGLVGVGNGADTAARARYPGWSIGIKANDGHVFTAPVGRFQPNAYGLSDMHGNVWEWCEDWYEPNSYPKEKQVDPTGPATGKAKVQRGGGWSSDAKRLRSAARVGRDASAYRGCYLGFRVVLEQESGTQSQEPESPKKLPAGLRVMSGGHSWSTENSAPLCQAAGITGHLKLNKQGLHSGRIEDLTPLLEKGEIDVYVWQHNSTGPDFPKFLPTLVDLGPKHNPNFRVIMQMPWLTNDGRKDVKSPEEYEKTDLAEYQTELEKSRKQQEAYIDEVNAKAGKRVVFLVPLGDGMLEVRKLIVAGKFPGITKVNFRETPGDRGSLLQGDIMPHQGLLGMRLGTYMHFAALYRMSPEGLKFPGKEGDGLTDAQREVLQKLAWDMVSKYPYAGIAKFDAPNPIVDAKSRFGLDVKTDRLIMTHADKPLGEYVWADQRILRPYFANLHGPGGTKVTRNHPPVPGTDAADHDTMHPGLWLGFGDISGVDFWRNRGRVRQVKFLAPPTTADERITFATESDLLNPDGKRMGGMVNRYTIARRPAGWRLVWDATFTATEQDLVFGDQEEMGFGARVASECTEKTGGAVVNSHGAKTAKATWGKPAAWCDYSGTKGSRRVGVTLMPGPKNFRESWWHNRDYGVFVANPFGRAAMGQGARSAVTVKKGESLRLVFGAVLHDGTDYDPANEYQHFLEAVR
ncbi:SUMF1/EgtB/PvdO family nonheme iron enzyme [Urbifossiella limnaea]|uniref:Serine/threonine-protein kinase pkn1 n=1 Tax=Urbifossiella limnaea TaxID=2528023 RepID=A0A517XQH1_9BACT|nr:SUMF1/EgtB/PvdO family nonheme iron enzyme [Urbifossiella limnaea]QDU19759.1 Serine/threonine-protein kinase pkn1 [Urbifossiella limnaea]